MVRSWQVCSFENPSGFYEISRNGRRHFCFCFESSRGRTSADFPYYPLGFDICDVIGTKAYTVEAAMFAFPFVLQTFCEQFKVEIVFCFIVAWIKPDIFCWLKEKSVENISGYIREQFCWFSRGCKPQENIINCWRK